MRRLVTIGTRWMVVGICAGALSSCGLWRQWFPPETAAPAEEEAEEQPVQVVGEVASVHGTEGGEGFVLIRRYGGGALPQGFIFHSQGPSGRTSSLRPTGERLGRFYAADVTSGTPAAGDLVMARQLPEAAEAPSTPVLAAPKPGLQEP